MNKVQILSWRVLSLRRKKRSPNPGSFSEVFELFPTDKLFGVRNPSDAKANSDFRS